MTKEEIFEKYKNSSSITEQEFTEILKGLGLMCENADENAQILCHGAGKDGVKHLDDIVNNSGIRIRNRQAVMEEKSNDAANSGILSTNRLMNNTKDNTIDIHKAYQYGYGNAETGKVYTVVTAIPQVLGDFVLGKILPRGGEVDRRACVLDDLGIGSIPKEFIVGVIVTDATTGEKEFQLNENFYALSQKNYDKAVDCVKGIYEKAKTSQEEYYSDLGEEEMISFRRILAGCPARDGMLKFKEEALKTFRKQKREKEQEETAGYTVDDN